jgi:ligand-binding sensor domain-containing protein
MLFCLQQKTAGHFNIKITTLKRLHWIGIFFFSSVLNIGITQNIFFHAHQFDAFKNTPISHVYQDDKGFIWASSHQDIYVYNGERIRRCNILSSEHGVIMNYINHIFQDSKDNIWISGKRTMAMYNGDVFIQIPLPSLNSLSFVPVEDASGHIWFSQLDENKHHTLLYTYHLEDKSIRPQEVALADLGPTSQNIFLAYIDDRRSFWWVYEDSKLYRQQPNAEAIYVGDVKSFGGDKIMGILQERKDKYWVWTANGRIFNWHPQHKWSLFDEVKGIEKYHDTELAIKGVNKDRHDNIWISAHDSLYMYHDSPEPGDAEVYHSLPSNALFGAITGKPLHDRDNGLWVPAHSGLHKITRKHSSFLHYIPDTTATEESKNNIVFEIVEGPGQKLWIGAPKYGVIGLNEQQEVVHFIPHTISTPDGKLTHTTTAIHVDQQHNLWLGTFYEGLFKLSLSTNRLAPLKGENGVRKYYREVVEDAKGNLWFVRQEGLDIVNPGTNTIKHYDIPLDESEKGSNYHLFSVIEIDGYIWFAGATRKLYKLHPETQTLIQYKVPGAYSVYCIVKDQASSKIWLGTIGNGLLAFDPALGTFSEPYTTSNGLASNIIGGILQDDKGILWLSTEVGLSRLNPSTGYIVNYNKDDGLPFTKFRTGAYCKSTNGRLHFGGNPGILSWHPDSLRKRNGLIHQPVFISQLSIYEAGKENTYVQGLALQQESITLSSDKNKLNIEFSCLDFRFPSKRKYQYRLQGWDEDWSSASKINTAYYQNLAYGKYLFELRGTNNEGEWNPQTTTLRIEVVRPLYESPVVRLIGSILAIAVAFILLNRHNKKKYQRLKSENLKAQLLALSKQMNPHFAKNTLNSISALILEQDSHSALVALNRFASLNQMLLYDFKQILIPLEKEIAFLRLYLDLQQRRFGQKLVYTIKQEGIDPALYCIPPMIFQPIIENSFAHAFTKDITDWKLNIVLHQQDNTLFCAIEDNGTGIPSAALEGKAGKSTSIANIKRRIGLYKKYFRTEYTIKVISPLPDGSAKGTRVEITLPLLDISYLKTLAHD